MVKCCSFSAVKSFLWFWSLSNGTEAKQFLMILHRTDNLLSYFDEFFNLLYILFACVLLFTFVKIHTLGNYLVALFLLTQTNGKFKKRLRFVRVSHCSLGRCNFKRTLSYRILMGGPLFKFRFEIFAWFWVKTRKKSQIQMI